MHVNREYVFQGGTVDPRQFFRARNLTRRIAKLNGKITRQLRTEFRILDQPEAPDIEPGRQCGDPVTCEFFDRCNPPPPDDHVCYIPRIYASVMKKLGEMGIESIHDIPDDFELSEIQRRACTSVQTGEPWYSPELNTELAKLEYPVHFADFETVNPAIPRFAGMRPYDPIPFQWSVHVQLEPGAVPEHFEFLAADASDPRREFIYLLCDALGKSGSVVVYSGFESQRLSELARWLPEFSGRIKKIQTRLFDLLPVVRNGVYHQAFGGSFSIKSVLPALVPDMTYAGMQIADGRAAGIAWESLVNGNLSQPERENTRRAVLDYCGQDTLAMVKLLATLFAAAIC